MQTERLTKKNRLGALAVFSAALLAGALSGAIERELSEHNFEFRGLQAYAKGAPEPYTGLVVWYHTNTRRKRLAQFNNGVLDGEQQYWFRNGRRQIVENYEMGSLHGERTEWFEDGTMKLEENYEEGRRHDTATEWFPSGLKKLRIKYNKGVKDGAETVWFESGRRKEILSFKDGNMFKTTTWYESGGRKSQTLFENGMKHGAETLWDENGIATVTNYSLGIIVEDRSDVVRVASAGSADAQLQAAILEFQRGDTETISVPGLNPLSLDELLSPEKVLETELLELEAGGASTDEVDG
ncbi:MAG: toxin-antitoxin system YwqK family antitoxin [Gammaproteobacteria bacterium AqS3]|nr:toxin-antitoxin system YwqK family antitoxin [Gammaproteobacteria bacterium AqS3]